MTILSGSRRADAGSLHRNCPDVRALRVNVAARVHGQAVGRMKACPIRPLVICQKYRLGSKDCAESRSL